MQTDTQHTFSQVKCCALLSGCSVDDTSQAPRGFAVNPSDQQIKVGTTMGIQSVNGNTIIDHHCLSANVFWYWDCWGNKGAPAKALRRINGTKNLHVHTSDTSRLLHLSHSTTALWVYSLNTWEVEGVGRGQNSRRPQTFSVLHPPALVKPHLSAWHCESRPGCFPPAKTKVVQRILLQHEVIN